MTHLLWATPPEDATLARLVVSSGIDLALYLFGKLFLPKPDRRWDPRKKIDDCEYEETKCDCAGDVCVDPPDEQIESSSDDDNHDKSSCTCATQSDLLAESIYLLQCPDFVLVSSDRVSRHDERQEDEQGQQVRVGSQRHRLRR